MERNQNKPTPEAKALSLFLMAFKSVEKKCKEEGKRMNRLYGLVNKYELSHSDYLLEVNNVLESYGGYAEVVEKTVQHYINKTGEWKLKGDDQYCTDAQEVADRIFNSRKKS